MGLAMHELLLLRRLSAEMGGSLGEVLTIGRQWLIVEHEQVASIVGKPVAPSKFADNTLAALGATRVSALDVSDYEGAEIVHDLNLPYAGGRQFDCVIDFGSLEHVFDMPTALRTLVRLTRPNGAILHVLPGNNLLSHGFWQVSSDLFLEFYCPNTLVKTMHFSVRLLVYSHS